ncbi:MAG: DNA-binding response regulator [Calditrichaeota bacterium]|nr:MAG: DNA-binding response regulator [Calditrichota bacterium]MBL1207649.1 DNA-binding response regulator [Calditrichota bacterium]NOG47482.1 response regulator transcription factor [Calditrichota bacterium]
MAEEIQVAIIEDDNEIRQLMTLIIDGSPGYICKHSYSSCEMAMDNLKKSPPHVVLMDIDLPGMSGIEGVKCLKDELPEIDCLMLTVQDDDDSIFNSICVGATGYLLKDTSPTEILKAIEEVHNGGSPMTASIARRIISSFKPEKGTILSGREVEILRHLCDGENYKVIAEKLHISGHTVRSHFKNIYKKLHVSTRAEAVRKAISDKLI